MTVAITLVDKLIKYLQDVVNKFEELEQLNVKLAVWSTEQLENEPPWRDFLNASLWSRKVYLKGSQ